MAVKLNKNWILLGVAIVLGLGAMALSNRVIHTRMAELEADAKRGQETVRVVVAARDLQRGDAVSSESVAVRRVPKEYVHHTAIRPEQFDNVDRQRLAVPLRRGEVLLEAHTEGKGASVFSATLKKGLRALTFEVDAVNSISGMLRPGDRIDLIYAARSITGNAGQEFVLPLMSDVEVLATGQSVSKDRDNDKRDRTYSTVTLEVSPFDANRIILAKSGGRLTAVLRNPDDRDRNATAPLSVASLLGQQTSDSIDQAEGRLVQYIIGGSGSAEKVLDVAAPTLPIPKK
jgi:pilus assembly protein CpaB